MNGNSSVNEDVIWVIWMKILLSRMIVVYMPATVRTYLLHGAESFLRI
jgi:hypothetical protein